MKMSLKVRFVVVLFVLISAPLYGVLVVKDARLAEAVALGYVAVLLTIFVLLSCWKKE